MRSLSWIYENSFFRERIKPNSSQTSCESLERAVTTDSKSFQRLHLFSPRVTLMPCKLDASLLFNYGNFKSEMTTPGREKIRNEIHLKEEDHSVLTSLLLWWHGSLIGIQPLNPGRQRGVVETQPGRNWVPTSTFLLPIPNPKESFPCSQKFVMPL